MSWFKVDDELHHHRKARIAGKGAMGVWVLAGSWASATGSNGFVPRSVLSQWGGTVRDAQRLVDAGFWEVGEHDGEKGWWFHDWAHYQPSAAVNDARKLKQREAGRRGNHERWHVNQSITDPDCTYCTAPPAEQPDDTPLGGQKAQPAGDAASGDPIATRSEDRSPTPSETRSGTRSEGESGTPTPDRSGFDRPVPVPDPDRDSAPDGAGRGATAAEATEPTAQTLLAEWIDRHETRPPKRVVGQIAKEIKSLLTEGQAAEHVRAGLVAWDRKSAGPSALPGFVFEAARQRPVDAEPEKYYPTADEHEAAGDPPDDMAEYRDWYRRLYTGGFREAGLRLRAEREAEAAAVAGGAGG